MATYLLSYATSQGRININAARLQAKHALARQQKGWRLVNSCVAVTARSLQ